MKKQKLLLLADFLEGLEKRAGMGRFFYVGTWIAKDENNSFCAACAGGWAMVLFPDLIDLSSQTLEQGIVLLAAYFGLSPRTAYSIFGTEPATPSQKAEQIRRLVKRAS